MQFDENEESDTKVPWNLGDKSLSELYPAKLPKPRKLENIWMKVATSLYCNTSHGRKDITDIGSTEMI